MLLKFQRKHLIETSSSSEDSDDQDKLNKIRLLDNPNPFIKLGAIAKIKKLLDTYKTDSLETTDKRLIRGLYLRKLKDYEDERASGGGGDGGVAAQNKMKLMSLIMGKGVTKRDIITPPPHILRLQQQEQKEYSEGIYQIINQS